MVDNKIVSRSWFAVFNNPELHGYEGTPESILEQLKQEWISGGNGLRKCWLGYCISQDGLKHVHLVLEDSVPCRFSKVKKIFPKAHLEPTKGSKSQVLNYIYKKPPFDEVGEKVICFTSHGNIEGHKRYSVSNLQETLSTIEQLVDEGYTPAMIMEQDIRLRREEGLIRKAYFAKRYKETPPIREVLVYWHCGDAGSGKTYEYISLCETFGDDHVYFFNDYSNKGSGGFDTYCGEEILFIDELKPAALPFEMLLTICQGYRSQIHCRYSNCYALWNEVHITSVFPPEEIYRGSVSAENYSIDTINQLLRRIHTIIYHYKNQDSFSQIEISGEDYTTYSDLKELANKCFEEVDEYIPF